MQQTSSAESRRPLMDTVGQLTYLVDDGGRGSVIAVVAARVTHVLLQTALRTHQARTAVHEDVRCNTTTLINTEKQAMKSATRCTGQLEQR